MTFPAVLGAEDFQTKRWQKAATVNRYHRLGWHHGIELFEASFSTQTFSRHAHEGFAIGAIAQGIGGYVCRGESRVIPTGSLSLMNPEEPHTGYAPAGQVRYNMIYASEKAVMDVLGLRSLRGFAEIAPPDENLAITTALATLARRVGSRVPDWHLGVAEAVHEVLAMVFTRYGRADLKSPGREPRAVAAVLARIAAGVEAGLPLTLADLAREVDLHPSYLVRSFARATGMTPHAHVVQGRVRYARQLLLNGMSAAEAAIAAGFYDQAHLIRHFRRHHGVSPGAMIAHV